MDCKNKIWTTGSENEGCCWILITPETKQTWREAKEGYICVYVHQTEREKWQCYGRSVILNKLQALLTDEKDTKTLVRRRTVTESEIFLTVYKKKLLSGSLAVMHKRQ